MTNLKTRIEKLERKLTAPMAPPTADFRIIDLADFPEPARAAYNTASERGDWAACDRLMHQFAGVPLPAPRRRRRPRGRPLRVVELVVDHLDSEPIDDDDRDPRERVGRDGTGLVVTSPLTVAPGSQEAFGPDDSPL